MLTSLIIFANYHMKEQLVFIRVVLFVHGTMIYSGSWSLQLITTIILRFPKNVLLSYEAFSMLAAPLSNLNKQISLFITKEDVDLAISFGHGQAFNQSVVSYDMHDLY